MQARSQCTLLDDRKSRTGAPKSPGFHRQPTSKKLPPNRRSNITKNSATVSGGIAKISSADVTNVVHVNMDILSNVIPGARMLTMVTMKLTAPAMYQIQQFEDQQYSNQLQGLHCKHWMQWERSWSNPNQENSPNSKLKEKQRTEEEEPKTQCVEEGKATSRAPI